MRVCHDILVYIENLEHNLKLFE